MDLNFTPDEQAFREEVRSFLKAELPDDIARKIKAGLATASGRLHPLAKDSLQARLGRTRVGQAVRRHGLGARSDAYFR